MPLSQPGLGTVWSVRHSKTFASPTTLFAHKCHLSPQMLVSVRDESFLHLCCSLLFLLNIVSILVSFCLWFDIVSVGVTLGRCAFSQVLNQYWLAIICYWLPLPRCQVTRFYHLSSRLCALLCEGFAGNAIMRMEVESGIL